MAWWDEEEPEPFQMYAQMGQQVQGSEGLPAGHPSNLLMWLRDQIPQVQADDSSLASGGVPIPDVPPSPQAAQPKRQAEFRNYDPTWREQIAQYMMGDSRASPERERLVRGVMGTTGLPGSEPSNLLMWLRDQIPQVQADDSSLASGITSRLGRTLTAIPRGGLETMANWLEGTHNPEAIRIGPDTAAPLGLFGMGMALAPKNSVGIFGGRLAQTADQNALAKAEKMAASGISREDIWKDTGWFQGVDGKWRFEIDDSGVAKTFDGVPLGIGDGPIETTLGKALGDQKVRDAYPSVDDVLYTSRWASNKMVPIGEHSAALAGGYGSIGHNQRPAVAMQHELLGSSTKDTAASRSLHETQHYLQDVEGFARGGMPSRADPAVRDAWRGDAQKWWDWAKKGWDDPERRALGRDYMQKMNAGEDVSKHPYAELARLNQEYGVTFAPGTKFPKNYMPAYRRLAGEVESRAVEARRHMTSDERRARPPWLDYDVPEARQVVRGVQNDLLADNARSSVPGTVVNAMGEQPQTIRAYHGTDAKFDKFDPARSDELGFHFGSKRQANSRKWSKAALENRTALPWPFANWRRIPVDIEANRIAKLTGDPGYFGSYPLANQLNKDGILPDEMLETITRAGGVNEQNTALRQWLTDQGYDLVQYPNSFEGRGSSYMALGTGNVRNAKTGEVMFSNAASASAPGLAANATQEGEGALSILRQFGFIQ